MDEFECVRRPRSLATPATLIVAAVFGTASACHHRALGTINALPPISIVRFPFGSRGRFAPSRAHLTSTSEARQPSEQPAKERGGANRQEHADGDGRQHQPHEPSSA